jgi:hypothetical protein
MKPGRIYTLKYTRCIIMPKTHITVIISAEKAVLAAQESFEYAKEQFGLGLINFVEYQNAQSSLSGPGQIWPSPSMNISCVQRSWIFIWESRWPKLVC